MKKLLILLLVLVTLIPSSASAIDIRKEGTIHQGGTRMPSITRASADYENGVVTVDISRYTGNVQVYVYDANGIAVDYTVSTISGIGTVALDAGILSEGEYTLYIVLDNTTYSGEFTL